MKLIVNMPDSWHGGQINDYVYEVGRLIADDYTSGHTDAQTHWTLEKG